MGHSSLAVSLTYLRGLEVSELEESDMPMVSKATLANPNKKRPSDN